MTRFYLRIFLCFIFFIGTANVALAVPPPDFLFNVGSQIVQAFTIVALFSSAFIASASKFARVYIANFRYKKILMGFSALVVIAASSTGAYYYGQYKQDQAYKQWIAESEAQNKNISAVDTTLDVLKVADSNEGTSTAVAAAPAVAAVRPAKVPRPKENKYIGFIRKYYSNLATGNAEASYAVSKKSVSLATYKSWYKDVTAVSVDDIQSIDITKYSLSLTLTEKGKTTRYGVLMNLKEDDAGRLSVESSKVRILSATESGVAAAASPTAKVAGSTPAQVVAVPAAAPPSAPKAAVSPENAAENSDFFNDNKNLELAISNEDFQNVINNGGDIYVLDSREDEEYEIGSFPNGVHIRFADLLAGEWISLPTDRIIYVFCWSGIRGKEVAEFLRSKKILSRYIENGADKWVSFGGKWNGGIKFSAAYPQERYAKTFEIAELKDKIASGTVIVDSRNKEKYNSWHIPRSINIPIIYTPSSQIEDLLEAVPAGKPVITVCDDFVSCFDAKLTGLKLERKGHEFLGRYNKPWEFRNAK